MTTILDKYERREVVGSGTSGTVLLCWDPRLDRDVAIKQVRLDALSDAQREELLARFRLEARVVGRLSHPGIVNVYDYEEHDGIASLVMEFVPGQTVQAFIRANAAQGAPCAPARAAAIVDAVLQALEHCHRHGIVHRDIKPGNILLTKDERPKLTDFGIARTPGSELTMPGTMIGTPAYMAPEQFIARAPADERADLYACGVLLFELLTGSKPFAGDLSAVMHDVINTAPAAPSSLNPAVPAAMDAVVLRAMQKHPDDRFPDAAAFATALARAAPTAHATVLNRTRSRLRLPGIAIAVACVIVLAIAAVLAMRPWHRNASPPHFGSAIPAGYASAARAEAAALLGQLNDIPCAVFGYAWREDAPGLVLAGVAGQGEARKRIDAALAGLAMPVDRAGLRDAPTTPALCGLVDLVRQVVGPAGLHAPGSLIMNLSGPRNPLVVGDAIEVAVVMARFDGVLRIDYVAAASGRAYFAESDQDVAVPLTLKAGQRWLGPHGDGVLGTVHEPVGTDVVVAFTSGSPLFNATRPDDVPLADYLRGLRQMVAEVRRRGEPISADVAVVETVGR